MDVQYNSVVNGQSEHNADQCKLGVAFKRSGVEPEVARVRVEGEHCIVRIEYLVYDQLKEFFGQTAFVNALLAFKFHHQLLFQIRWILHSDLWGKNS